MQALADKGIGTAAQYVGRYREDLATKVGNIFGNKGPAQSPQVYDPAALTRAVQGLTPEQRTSTLKTQNAIISGLDAVTDEDSWNTELGKLKQMGVPVDQYAGFKNWQVGYAMAKAYVDARVRPVRDAIADTVTAEVTGAPMVQPGLPKGQQYKISGYTSDGRPIYYNPANPAQTYTGDQPVSAKPSAGVALINARKQMAIDAGMARSAAEREQYNLLMANPDMPGLSSAKWVDDEEKKIYTGYKSGSTSTNPGGGAGGAPQRQQGAPSGGPPQRAIDTQLKPYPNQPRKFPNGQVWMWNAKTNSAERVK
jgi:hypothetical protein